MTVCGFVLKNTKLSPKRPYSLKNQAGIILLVISPPRSRNGEFFCSKWTPSPPNRPFQRNWHHRISFTQQYSVIPVVVGSIGGDWRTTIVIAINRSVRWFFSSNISNCNWKIPRCNYDNTPTATNCLADFTTGSNDGF